jgi:hypothetical protein
LAQGVISQKGLATSVLEGNGQVAVICDGNPLVISNMQNGSTLAVDPDAAVCWMGADPAVKFDLSWKNLVGQASGESYMFEWNKPAAVVVQPNERTSGIDIGMDGQGGKPTRQNNNLFRQSGNQGSQGPNQGSQAPNQGNQAGGMLGALGNLLNN